MVINSKMFRLRVHLALLILIGPCITACSKANSDSGNAVILQTLAGITSQLETSNRELTALRSDFEAAELANAELRTAATIITAKEAYISTQAQICFTATNAIAAELGLAQGFEVEALGGAGLDTVKLGAKIAAKPKLGIDLTNSAQMGTDLGYQICILGRGRQLDGENLPTQWLADLMAALEGQVSDTLLNAAESLGISEGVPDQMDSLIAIMSSLDQVVPESPEELFQLGDSLRDLRESMPGPPALIRASAREFEVPSLVDFRLCEWIEGSDVPLANSVRPLCNILPPHDGEILSNLETRLEDFDRLLAVQDYVAESLMRIEDTLANVDLGGNLPDLPVSGGGADTKPLCDLPPRLRPRSCPGSTR